MKNLLILMLVCFISFSASAQLVIKTTTSSKTAGKNIIYSTDKASQPFSIHTVLDSAEMHANDTILMTMFVSNNNVNWVAYPSFSTLTYKKTTCSQVTSGTLVYKYLKLTYSPPTGNNDSTFTITSNLFKQ